MFGKLLNWLPVVLETVVLVEAITGLDGPSKKEKATALTVGLLSILGENITDDAKDQIGSMINGTVAVLNAGGIFETTGTATDEEIEEDLEEEIEEEEKPVLGKKKKATKKKG